MSAAASPFSPFRVGPITLRNRVIKSATNEGMALGPLPSKGLARFHESMAEGGVAMTTVAYCSTSLDGRTFADQVTMDDDAIPHLRVLTDAVHKHGAAASAQITHAGCFTFLPPANTKRPLSASGGFNKVGVMSRQFFKQAMTEEDRANVAQEFVDAAIRARESGFDAVELHMGHGYLLSQFISPLYNRRSDAWGGTLGKRMRYPVEVLSRVLDAVGKDMAVVVKYSTHDGVPKGNSIEDGIEIAKILEGAGAHLLVLSAGMNVESITTMFGSGFPKANRGRPANPVVALGMLLQQLMEPKDVRFREMYLLEGSRRIRQAVKLPLAYLGGVQSLANMEQAMAEGFEAVAMGRALIFDPALVEHIKSGSVARSGCTICNLCVQMMYTPGGTSCVLHAPNDAALNKIPAAG